MLKIKFKRILRSNNNKIKINQMCIRTMQETKVKRNRQIKKEEMNGNYYL